MAEYVKVGGKLAQVIDKSRHGVYTLRILGDSNTIQRISTEVEPADEPMSIPMVWDSGIIPCQAYDDFM